MQLQVHEVYFDNHPTAALFVMDGHTTRVEELFLMSVFLLKSVEIRQHISTPPDR